MHARRSTSLPSSSSGASATLLRPAHRGRILHRAVEHHRHEQQHDEVEQQRGHDLVDAEARLQRAQARAAAARRPPSRRRSSAGTAAPAAQPMRAAGDRDRRERAEHRAGLRRRCCRSARETRPPPPGRSGSAASRASASRSSAKREPKRALEHQRSTCGRPARRPTRRAPRMTTSVNATAPRTARRSDRLPHARQLSRCGLRGRTVVSARPCRGSRIARPHRHAGHRQPDLASSSSRRASRQRP